MRGSEPRREEKVKGRSRLKEMEDKPNSLLEEDTEEIEDSNGEV